MHIILIAALYFPLDEDPRDFKDMATIYPPWYLRTVFVDFVVNDLLHSDHCCFCSAFDYLLQAFLWELGWIGDSNSGLLSCTLHVSKYCPACTRDFCKIYRWWQSSLVVQGNQSENVKCWLQICALTQVDKVNFSVCLHFNPVHMYLCA